MTYFGFSEVGPMTKEAEEQCRKEKFNYYDVEYRLKQISGRVLTLCEASFSDLEQRKAVKDIVRQLMSDAMLAAYEFALNPNPHGEGSDTK